MNSFKCDSRTSFEYLETRVLIFRPCFRIKVVHYINFVGISLSMFLKLNLYFNDNTIMNSCYCVLKIKNKSII